MPDFFDVIRGRRSVRKYQTQQVPRSLVEEVLAAAGWAPSAHNAQPYGFIVLENAQTKLDLAEAMAKVWVADLEKDGQTIAMAASMIRMRAMTAESLITASATLK